MGGLLGGAKGYVGPPYQIIGGAWPPLAPPFPTPMCFRQVPIKFLYNSKFDFTAKHLVTNPVAITRVLRIQAVQANVRKALCGHGYIPLRCGETSLEESEHNNKSLSHKQVEAQKYTHKKKTQIWFTSKTTKQLCHITSAATNKSNY